MELRRATLQTGAQGDAMTHTPRFSTRTFGLLLAWLALWAVVVATWLYDADGYAAGMPGPVFLLMLLGPLLGGLVLGWGKGSLGQGMKAGAVGGVVYGLANMGGQLLWGLVLRALGRIPSELPAEVSGPVFFVMEVVEFTLLFTITGLTLGLMGGLAGAALSRRR